MARFKREKVQAYQSELVYLMVKRHYTGVTAPSEFADKVWKPPVKRKPDREIVSDLISKLRR